MRKTLTERFARCVDKTPGYGPTGNCWRWTAYVCKAGYGRITVNNYPRLAHRISYELHTGSVVGQLFVCHACDNPTCVNPAHLWVGTGADNMRDKCEKGRCNNGRSALTHCKEGHELGGDNVYISQGSRACRICIKIKSRARYLSLKSRIII